MHLYCLICIFQQQKPFFSFTVLGDDDLSESSVNVSKFLSPLAILARGRNLRQLLWNRKFLPNFPSHLHRQIRSPLIVSDQLVRRVRVITSARPRHPSAIRDGWWQFPSESPLDGVPAGLVLWVPASLFSITGIFIYRHELHAMAYQIWHALSSTWSSVSSYRQLLESIQKQGKFVSSVLKFVSANRKFVHQIYKFVSVNWEFVKQTMEFVSANWELVKQLMEYISVNWEFLKQSLEFIAENWVLLDRIIELIGKFWQCLSALWRGSRLCVLASLRSHHRKCKLFPALNGIGVEVILHPRYESIRTLHRYNLSFAVKSSFVLWQTNMSFSFLSMLFVRLLCLLPFITTCTYIFCRSATKILHINGHGLSGALSDMTHMRI